MRHILAAAVIQTLYPFLTMFGVACALRRRQWEGPPAIAGALAILGAAAFAAFIVDWVALPNTAVQTVIGIVAIGSSMLLALKALVERQWSDEVAIASLLAFACTITLLVWTYWGSDLVNPLAIAATRWTHELPPDSQIPLHFAEAFQSGILPTGQPSDRMGDWLYSDRPPLQAALFMMTPGFLRWGADAWAYQCAAASFQMFALLGVWTLVRSMTARPWVALLAVVATFFTPLVLVNGIFVWPKLLAASFLLCLASIQLSPQFASSRSDPVSGGLVGALAALALLSHGTAAFAILGIGLSCLLLRRFGSGRYIAAVIGVGLLLYAPWFAYQKFVDPPGDRLLKWHLAGVVPIDQRSFVDALKDSYKAKTWTDIIATREGNMNQLAAQARGVLDLSVVAATDLIAGRRDEASRTGKSLRVNQFFYVIAATGLLGIFFVLGFLGLLTPDTRGVVTAVLATIIVWIGLLFSASTANTHQGSYFPELGVIAIAVVLLAKWWRPGLVIVVMLHCGLTIFQYSL